MPNSFVKFPRILLENVAWVDARPEHRVVFETILLKSCFKKSEHNIQGNIIELEGGQLCATFRQIAEWCGKWITKNHVEGAIKYFTKVNFLRQEVRHGKTILTLCQPDICKQFEKSSPTTSQTEVRQESDIKEERQESHVDVGGRSVASSNVKFCKSTKQFIGWTAEQLQQLRAALPAEAGDFAEHMAVINRKAWEVEGGDIGNPLHYCLAMLKKANPRHIKKVHPLPTQGWANPAIKHIDEIELDPDWIEALRQRDLREQGRQYA